MSSIEDIENVRSFLFKLGDGTDLRLIEKENYDKLVERIKELEEYISIAPNLDKMTATKYVSIQQEAYIRGRAEEQQKAEEIIVENYISKEKVKDVVKEAIEIIESEQFKIIMGDMTKVGRLRWLLEEELLEDK